MRGTQMKLQKAWRLNSQLQTKVCTQLNDWDAASGSSRHAIIEDCPQNHCERHRSPANVQHWHLDGIKCEKIGKVEKVFPLCLDQ